MKFRPMLITTMCALCGLILSTALGCDDDAPGILEIVPEPQTQGKQDPVPPPQDADQNVGKCNGGAGGQANGGGGGDGSNGGVGGAGGNGGSAEGGDAKCTTTTTTTSTTSTTSTSGGSGNEEKDTATDTDTSGGEESGGSSGDWSDTEEVTGEGGNEEPELLELSSEVKIGTKVCLFLGGPVINGTMIEASGSVEEGKVRWHMERRAKDNGQWNKIDVSESAMTDGEYHYLAPMNIPAGSGYMRICARVPETAQKKAVVVLEGYKLVP